MSHPINPHSIQPARDCLDFLYQLSGRVTLSGQHNFIGRMSTMSDQMKAVTGKTPAVWGTDFGFSGAPGDIDYIGERPKLLTEIQKQYAQGCLIVMTYHQGNPLVGEPCDFIGGVQSKLSDAEWEDLLTPGAAIHHAWQAQMDLLADLFKQLQALNIPVIFRPYHEMNGTWFWWGNRPGPNGFARLWKQLYHYYTDTRQLNNLLWAWCTDRPWEGIEDYYPGADYVDILGSDIYPLKDHPVVYRPEWFTRMKTLAAGKPLALTENSVIPDEEVLESQPWLWFMGWTDLPFEMHSHAELRARYANPRILGLEDLANWRDSGQAPS